MDLEDKLINTTEEETKRREQECERRFWKGFLLFILIGGIIGWGSWITWAVVSQGDSIDKLTGH